MIEINGIKFSPNKDCNYKYDYVKAALLIHNGEWNFVNAYRTIILNDLWFIVQFVMCVEGANHPFIVQACRDVENGPATKTLDLWARGHFKSSVITTAETIQRILKDKEQRIGLFSHTRPSAKGFLRRIKLILEGNQFLKDCFPDVLYMNPTAESPKWSEDDGLIVRRNGYYNESTIEAWGLIEGMPTGKHFTYRVYDDIETPDMVTTPEVMEKLKSMFDVSRNLSSKDGQYRVVGTPYHHMGLLQELRGKNYVVREKPATHDGTPSGKPVYLSQETLDDLKTSMHFNSQQLLNPTPKGTESLNESHLKEISPEMIPGNVYKFMLIDQAGDEATNKGKDGDSWAIGIVAVEPKSDDVGASNVYITDLWISPASESEALEQAVRMYCNAGVVMKVGVEKVGVSTTHIHLAKALQGRGRYVSIENETLVLLRPAGRNKVKMIESALVWPLNNSKIHMSSTIPHAYKAKLREEMAFFPYGHDDGINMLAYLYDLIKDYRFPRKTKSTTTTFQELGIV